MKKTAYLILASLQLLLTGCYEEPYISDEHKAPKLVTLPMSDDRLYGELDRAPGRNENFYFEVCDNKDFDEEETLRFDAYKEYWGEDNVRYILYRNLDGQLAAGKHYYRVCASFEGDVVKAKNIEEFTVVLTPKMAGVENLSGYTAALVSTCNIILPREDFFNGTYEVSWMVSENADFSNSFTVGLSDARQTSTGCTLWSHVAYNLLPGHHYYAKCVIKEAGETHESEPYEFKTYDVIKIGKVTFTDWDGETRDFTDDTFRFAVKGSNGTMIAQDMWAARSSDGWKIDGQVVQTGNKDIMYALSAQGANPSYSSNGIYTGFQNYKYHNQDVLWASSSINGDGVSDINFGHRMARAIFHINVADDYPIENPVISEFTVSGRNIVTYCNFNITTGSFTSLSSESPLAYTEGIKLTQGKSVDQTLYVFPASSGTATISMRTHDEFQYTTSSSLSVEWESGRTYEYTITLTKNQIIINDVYVRPWDPANSGNININDK